MVCCTAGKLRAVYSSKVNSQLTVWPVVLVDLRSQNSQPYTLSCVCYVYLPRLHVDCTEKSGIFL